MKVLGKTDDSFEIISRLREDNFTQFFDILSKIKGYKTHRKVVSIGVFTGCLAYLNKEDKFKLVENYNKFEQELSELSFRCLVWFLKKVSNGNKYLLIIRSEYFYQDGSYTPTEWQYRCYYVRPDILTDRLMLLDAKRKMCFEEKSLIKFSRSEEAAFGFITQEIINKLEEKFNNKNEG